MINRRSFIAGVTSLATAIAIAPRVVFAKPTPVLYGDGKHDDTEALQAWFDGDRVVYSDGAVAGGPTLANREFLISGPITLRGNAERHFTYNRVRFHSLFLVSNENFRNKAITNCVFEASTTSYGAGIDMTKSNGRPVRREKTPEGVRWYYTD
jgi:hypothetical protein